jgi:hypothetical protein
LGVDLSAELEETRRELPIAELPDEFLPPQSILIRDSARALGYAFKKNPMLVDQSKCTQGAYSYAAKWKARSYLTEASERGATLITRATVRCVICDEGQAIGVEYAHKRNAWSTQVRKAYGKRIVLSAGALATPKLLIDCGVRNIGNRGFFCKPAFMVCGTVPRLKGKDAYIGTLDIDLGNGVSIGDGAMNASLFKLFMLGNFKWRHLFAHSRTLAVGVLMNDDMGGEVGADGRYHKCLTAEELQKLEAAADIATNILKRAGARGIFKTRLVAGIPGGALRIKEHVDGNLQTPVRNLYVCDHSVISDQRITPTVTLICLAKRLARHLDATLRSPRRLESVAQVY